jgi:hypothetical protein
VLAIERLAENFEDFLRLGILSIENCPPCTQPTYELWCESAISELVVAKEITEFAYRSVGVDRTQPFPNSRGRRLTGPRSRAKKERARSERRENTLAAWPGAKGVDLCLACGHSSFNRIGFPTTSSATLQNSNSNQR